MDFKVFINNCISRLKVSDFHTPLVSTAFHISRHLRLLPHPFIGHLFIYIFICVFNYTLVLFFTLLLILTWLFSLTFAVVHHSSWLIYQPFIVHSFHCYFHKPFKNSQTLATAIFTPLDDFGSCSRRSWQTFAFLKKFLFTTLFTTLPFQWLYS